MQRKRNHRDRNSRRSVSIFEPLEGRRMMSGGELDPTFGTGGIASLPISSIFTRSASDVAVQADGKTIVVGTSASGPYTAFTVARFDVSGKLDPTFSGGWASASFGNSTVKASAVALQPDGKIVVVGTRDVRSGGILPDRYNEFAVARFNTDGTLDKSFDGDGKKSFRIKEDSIAYDVAIQRDGKILIAGSDFNGGTTTSGYVKNSDFAVARLHPSGLLDSKFGVLGRTTVPMGDWETAYAITIDYTGTPASNPHFGKIILAGSHGSLNSRFDPSFMALARLNTNGRIDGSFDRVPGLPDTGYNIDPFPGRKKASLKSVLMQPDGKIVVAGYAGDDTKTSYQFALARYDANGKIDRSFGASGNGTVETGFGGEDYGHELIQTANGDLILGGLVNNRFALAAYDANGRLKTSFGTDGRVKLDAGKFTTFSGVGLAAGTDGRLLIAGGDDFVTARLLPQKQKISISNRIAEASEAGPVPGMVRIHRDGAYSTPTRVYLEVSGNAVLGSDYSSNLTTVSSIGGGSGPGGTRAGGSSNAGSVIAGGIGGIIGGITGNVINSNLRYIDIPAGQRFVNVPVNVIDDSNLEPNETAIFTLAADASYELAGSTQASVTIKDNDEVHVNFQTGNRTPPAGHAPDLGHAFGDRGTGLFYGWDVDNTANTRIRNNTGSPDLRYDTLNHMQKPGGGSKWEIAVPNGLYTVRIVAGDPSNTDSVYKMNLEGTRALDGTPSGDTRWFRSTVNVLVSDGRLTLSNADGAVNNKIAFIDIKSAAIGAQPGAVAVNLPVRLVSAATANLWRPLPSGLFADNQIDESIWT